eukprot:g1878.t1
MVSFKITMMKPKVPGKVKLDLAKTVQSKEAFRKHPFYTFRSVWKLQPYPAGGTRITRIVRDFKQWEIFDFDALNAVSRSIEVENEEIRQSWTSALRVQPDKALAKHDLQRGQICQVEVNSKEMYSASFLLEVSVDQAFRSITSNGLLTQYHNHLCADSFLCLDEMRVLIRQVNGIVLLADMGSWMTMTVGHNAGSKEKALEVTTEQEVLSKPLYRVVNEWHFRSDNGKTLVRRSSTGTMRDFMQMEEGIPDLPATLTEAADEENRKIIKAFERMRTSCGDVIKLQVKVSKDGVIEDAKFKTFGCGSAIASSSYATEMIIGQKLPPVKIHCSVLAEEAIQAAIADYKGKQQSVSHSASAAMSVRANYAMRQMPAILDHAAKNHVLEVREMLEEQPANLRLVKGADPNYIHVRKDSWAISDTRLEFYEEITPLVVAAEYGACEVIKVLFNHPQIDVNLCCCAFNDSEIYNYYTAYDVTIAKKHPHAAALLRARGVLPATSEHVYKPPFDPVHGRPLRETLNHTYEEDSFGEGEMPRWDTVAQGDPELALELQKVADALSTSKGQSLRNRNKIFKALITDWHPDRAQNSYRATRVFQWLQVVKPWPWASQRVHASIRQPFFCLVMRGDGVCSSFHSAPGLPDGDGYHDIILPCGLFQEEVIELMYRDLNPEDYDLLNKLDERVSKKNTMGRQSVEKLPRQLAKECECTQCGICLAEVAPNDWISVFTHRGFSDGQFRRRRFQRRRVRCKLLNCHVGMPSIRPAFQGGSHSARAAALSVSFLSTQGRPDKVQAKQPVHQMVFRFASFEPLRGLNGLVSFICRGHGKL